MADVFKPRAIGILGGMGPAATVDLLAKIIALTPARCDQDHVPVVVYGDPRIPDRSRAIETSSDAPLPPMVHGIRTLQRSGAAFIAIPCNTAHHWHPQLARHSRVPILHIVDAVIEQACSRDRPFALMATRGTVCSGIYRERFERLKLPLIEPPDDAQRDIDDAIGATKAGAIDSARRHAEAAAGQLFSLGAHTLLLACTELPIAFAGSALLHHCLDTTEALARACVSASLGAAMSGALRLGG